MNNTIELVVDGKLLNRTWSDIYVKRTMESLCSTFQFVTVQQNPNFDYKQWPIQMGAPVIVLVDGEQVLSGYIEDINIAYDDKSHTVQIAGRDRTCDLADCHKSNGPYAFGVDKASRVSTIVRAQCAPFGIDVVIDPSAASAAALGKSTFWVSPGDPIMGALYQITRWAKVFMLATTDGKLMLTMAGSRSADVALMSGKNILKGGLKQSDRDRFSVYRVRGYSADTDNLTRSEDWLWMNGTYPPSPPTTYPDARTGATRYRPYAQLAETAVKLDQVGWMSKAEAQYRIGNSRKFDYTVQGWREKAGGQLWTPNVNVNVTDPRFGLDNSSLLIETVAYTQTNQGTATVLSLCSKEKYTAQAEINRIKTVFDSNIGSK